LATQADSDAVDVSTNGNVTKQCEDECNEDLEDEELDVEDEESDGGRRKDVYDNQLRYFDTRINDDSSGTRTPHSPSAVMDTEDVSPPVIPKPLPHPGVALGGLHQPAGANGPPCWSLPPGLASQFAWMPVYRSASPASKCLLTTLWALKPSNQTQVTKQIQPFVTEFVGRGGGGGLPASCPHPKNVMLGNNVSKLIYLLLLIICVLFNDAVSSSDFIPSTERMINK
jgi:hypothetical protein